MRILVQRVSWARVKVGDAVVGEIGDGLCLLVGVTHTDDAGIAEKLADKVANLRVFDDDEGVMNRSLLDAGGSALVVSQFTLYGNIERGRRPSWIDAARPEDAEPLIEVFTKRLVALGLPVATGKFRADMDVELCNCGPVTLMIELPAQSG